MCTDEGLLILLALHPQFTDQQSSWPVAAQIGVLGLVFTATVAVFYGFLATAARTALAARQAAARAITRLSGAAMITVGIALIAERLLTT